MVVLHQFFTGRLTGGVPVLTGVEGVAVSWIGFREN